MEENINLLERFYQPLLTEKDDYSNSAYKTLEKNGIDPSPLLNIKEVGAGNIELNKDEKIKNEEGKSFVKALADFAVDLPKDAILSTNLAVINGLDLSVNLIPTINKMFAATNPNYQRILNASDFDDKIYADLKKISDGFAKDRENTYKALEDTNGAAQLLGMIFQDIPYAVPAHKMFKKIGLPNGIAVPLSVGVGAAMGYAPDQSFLVNSETVKNLKELVKVLPETPEEEVLDRTFMALEGSVYGSMVPIMGKVFKYIKKNVPKFAEPQSTISVGGAAATGEGALQIEDKIINNRLEDIEGDRSDLPDDNLIAAIGPEAAKLAVQYLKSQGKKVQDLKKLSGGTGRSVFELNDDQVIKIAKMQRGIRENINEMNDFMIDSWRPKVFDQGDDYVVVEAVKRADSEVRKFLKPLQEFNAIDWDRRDAKLQDAMTKLGLDDFLNYDLLWNDFKAARNWGKTKDGRIVLIDGGALDKSIMDKDVPEYVAKDWQNILSGRKKEGMGKFIITMTSGSAGYNILGGKGQNIILNKTEN